MATKKKPTKKRAPAPTTRSKVWCEKNSEPFLEAGIRLMPDGRLQIDVDYNRFAVASIQSWYKSAKRNDFNVSLPERDQVVMYLAEMFAGLIDYKLLYGRDEDDDDLRAPMESPDSIPIIGTEPVRDVVDVATADRVGLTK